MTGAIMEVIKENNEDISRDHYKGNSVENCSFSVLHMTEAVVNVLMQQTSKYGHFL